LTPSSLINRLSLEVRCSKSCRAFADPTRDLLDRKQEIAEFQGPGAVKISLHTHLDAAKATIAKIRMLEGDYKAHVALAHDASWLRQGTDRVLMSLLDDKMKVAAKEKIPYDEIP
jgi:hypothetical protein